MNLFEQSAGPARASLFVAALWCLVGLTGCGDPCRDLSEKVCNCEPTQARRQACLQQVSTKASQYSPVTESEDKAGRDRCALLLPGCTCDALSQGNLAACGLANGP